MIPKIDIKNFGLFSNSDGNLTLAIRYQTYFRELRLYLVACTNMNTLESMQKPPMIF